MKIVDTINEKFQASFLGRFFEMEERKTSFTTELRGALATFMSMSYILAVNPRILADSGGPCEADEDGIFGDAYNECYRQIQREFITSTAIASCFGCLAMGLFANLPIALAPGMGVNAYFTYSVVGFRGLGKISYEAAVTAVLIEGAIFLFLAVSGIRYALVRLVPEPVRVATPAAIGAFLAHLGLQTAEGIGVVVGDIATAVTIGGCPESKRTPLVALTDACVANPPYDCVQSDGYQCDSGEMSAGTTWVGILGLMIMLVMLAYKNRSAFLVGISFVTFISWFRGTTITYFPDTQEGDERFDYFKQVVSIERLDTLLAPYTSELGEVGIALFTFLYVDFLDTSGTLMALVSAMGYVDEEGNFPRARQAFAADACATMLGSVFGLSPVTSYIESGAGVEAGARTGLTAVLCGIFFFLSIFFAPILASIPPWATGGSLVIVGALMAKSLSKVKWYDVSHAATAFVTVMVMPLTYSIAYGLIAGIGCWVILQTTFWVLSLVGIEKPVFVDPDAVVVVEGAGTSADVDPTQKEAFDDSEEDNGGQEGAEIKEAAVIDA